MVQLVQKRFHRFFHADARTPAQPLAKLLLENRFLFHSAAQRRLTKAGESGPSTVLSNFPIECKLHTLCYAESGSRGSAHSILMLSEELAACEQLVVDDVKNLALYSRFKASEHVRLRRYQRTSAEEDWSHPPG